MSPGKPSSPVLLFLVVIVKLQFYNVLLEMWSGQTSTERVADSKLRCDVVSSILHSMVVSAAIFCIFVNEVAELPLVATSSECQAELANLEMGQNGCHLVEQTKSRPIASGALTPFQGVSFLGAQLFLGLGILLQLNDYRCRQRSTSKTWMFPCKRRLSGLCYSRFTKTKDILLIPLVLTIMPNVLDMSFDIRDGVPPSVATHASLHRNHLHAADERTRLQLGGTHRDTRNLHSMSQVDISIS
ncbi:4-hydroxybenzoate polyprenyltransferase, mitochondrial [Tanacetum coccineum]